MSIYTSKYTGKNIDDAVEYILSLHTNNIEVNKLLNGIFYEQIGTCSDLDINSLKSK